MFLEAIGILWGSSMIQSGKEDLKNSKKIRNSSFKEESCSVIQTEKEIKSDEYETKGLLKTVSGLAVLGGSILSFVGELTGIIDD